ncbi:hypothetical protein [Bacillus bombysepticus]|uniref:hypothetical protein n=1 Tax=Bacillus bombysepticus TaxID=658666 RepID=UPI003015AF6E
MNNSTQQNTMQRFEESSHLFAHLDSRHKTEVQYKLSRIKRTEPAKPLKHALLYAEKQLKEMETKIKQVEMYINEEFRLENPNGFYEKYQQFEAFLLKKEEWISNIELLKKPTIN